MKKLLEQFVKFGIVGVICFGIDFAVFSFLNYVVNVHYAVAAFWGFVISVIINYLLSMKFVFVRKEQMNRKTEFVIFVILSVIGLGLNELIILGCVDGIYAQWEWLNQLISDDLAEITGKIVATGIVMVYNFITRKIFLEKKGEPNE
ncbi:MAG: GtrA family protein [Lachnospiraceae bacterium]|nr:GtrA family protein [Lachnospiraceae bacterium]